MSNTGAMTATAGVVPVGHSSSHATSGSSSSRERSSGRSSQHQIKVVAEQMVRNSTRGKEAKYESVQLVYESLHAVGQGSFGTVFSARISSTKQKIAIKKVLQDRRFKNRELSIMKRMLHPNVITLHYFFYTCGSKSQPDSDVYLNLVMDYVPENVHRQIRHYYNKHQVMPYIYIKLYIYQLFRALNYIHKDNICHRDIKPQNLLCNPATGVLKLCDFGSAKQLDPKESNVSYICSRYYRAPELILCAVHYTCAIDVWSCGCVLGELMLNQPLFQGDTGVDQLVEIIKILGTPSEEQTDDMNPEASKNFHFPVVRSNPWNRVFRDRTPQTALDLANIVLEFSPQKRVHSLVALAHPFFDELRDPNQTMPDGKPLPYQHLFHLTVDECYTLLEAKDMWNGGCGKDRPNIFEDASVFGSDLVNLRTEQQILKTDNESLIKNFIKHLQGNHSIQSTDDYDSVKFQALLPQSNQQKINTDNLIGRSQNADLTK